MARLDLEDERGGLEILIGLLLWCAACLAAIFSADGINAVLIICIAVMWFDLNRLIDENIARLRRKRERLERQIEYIKRLRGDE